MDLGILALICAAALLGPVLSLVSRGAVPVVVGQLLAGVVLGRTLLDVVDPAKADLALLYDVGFATLMFTVGMHVPLHDRRLRSALGEGARAALVVVPLSLAAGLVCHLAESGPALVYALVIASSSATVALPSSRRTASTALPCWPRWPGSRWPTSGQRSRSHSR